MTEWHGGKGSRDRTKDRDKFNENFERIFNKRKIDITKLKNVWEEKSTRRKRKVGGTGRNAKYSKKIARLVRNA